MRFGRIPFTPRDQRPEPDAVLSPDELARLGRERDLLLLSGRFGLTRQEAIRWRFGRFLAEQGVFRD